MKIVRTCIDKWKRDEDKKKKKTLALCAFSIVVITRLPIQGISLVSRPFYVTCTIITSLVSVFTGFLLQASNRQAKNKKTGQRNNGRK